MTARSPFLTSAMTARKQFTDVKQELHDIHEGGLTLASYIWSCHSCLTVQGISQDLQEMIKFSVITVFLREYVRILEVDMDGELHFAT